MDSKQLQMIEERARFLLMREPRERRQGLLYWARNEMLKVGIDSNPSSKDPQQGCHDLIGSNPALPDWIRARGIELDNLLRAETFEDLIDRLTPAYGDSSS